MPGDVAEELKQGYPKNAARNMGLCQEPGKLLLRLWEQDITVIALKGAQPARAEIQRTIE